MTLPEYQACLNHLGHAAWTLHGARRWGMTDLQTQTLEEAFELARLALHRLVATVQAYAEREHGFDACGAVLGDPLANLDQQEAQLDAAGPEPYWRIAGPLGT